MKIVRSQKKVFYWPPPKQLYGPPYMHERSPKREPKYLIVAEKLQRNLLNPHLQLSEN
jgi:hypothetical protein